MNRKNGGQIDYLSFFGYNSHLAVRHATPRQWQSCVGGGLGVWLIGARNKRVEMLMGMEQAGQHGLPACRVNPRWCTGVPWCPMLLSTCPMGIARTTERRVWARGQERTARGILLCFPPSCSRSLSRPPPSVCPDPLANAANVAFIG